MCNSRERAASVRGLGRVGVVGKEQTRRHATGSPELVPPPGVTCYIHGHRLYFMISVPNCGSYRHSRLFNSLKAQLEIEYKIL